MKIKSILIWVIFSFVYEKGWSQTICSSDSASIYLTFDDGPVKASTFLLSLIFNDSLPVNVFVVGEHVYTLPEGQKILEQYRRNPNVEIDNHSYCHANKKYKKFYSHPEKVIADVLLNEDTLELKNKIVRLPGRNVWRLNGRNRNDLSDAKIAADSLSKLGFKVFGWDIEWMYDTAQGSFFTAVKMANIIRNLLNSNKTFTPGHIIILCHDSMLDDKVAREQLSLFLKLIKEDNCWRFKLLKFYPSSNNAAGTDIVQVKQ